MTSPTRATPDLIEGIIDAASIRSVFQPIVELDTATIVAFEALTRGPAGSPLESPDELFAAAAERGRSSELDRLCLRSAVANAEQHLPVDVPVFVNVEPSTLNSALIERTAPIASAGERTVVLEVTERALAADPAALLAGVASARERGWLVALDDVGVEPASLAFLPIIQPDVVKLDMGLIRDRPDRELGRTMTAVMAHAERTGALLLAEGIESDEHLDRAVSLGATLGQGYRFGRPAPHHDPGSATSRLEVPRAGGHRPVALSPFDAVAATGHRVRVARKDLLLQISHQIEEQGSSDPGAPLVLGAFQEARRFTPATARRYSRLARSSAFVAALGVAMDPEPADGVRGAAIVPGDPLEGEWSVIVLGPHYAGALLGKDLGDRGTEDGEAGSATWSPTTAPPSSSQRTRCSGASRSRADPGAS